MDLMDLFEMDDVRCWSESIGLTVHYCKGSMFAMHFFHLSDGEQKVSIQSDEALLQVLFLSVINTKS